MRMQTPYEAYRHACETSNPSMQIIMLYEAAIKYVKQAKEAIQQEDHDTRYQLIDKAMAIVRGLRACLDFSASEEVAMAMDKYYEAIDKLLISVQCDPNEQICDGIIKNLQTIKETWSDINLITSDLPENDNNADASEDVSA